MKKRSIYLTLSFVAICLSLVSAELAFRALLFHGPAFMKPLRSPGLYANGQSSDDYWKLRSRFGQPAAVCNDPLLGYRKPDILPDTYLHAKNDEIAGRTPVLLYGDSFAQCSIPPQDCFEGILNDNSQLASRYYLLNYGVGAYGLDQIYLLYQNTIDNYHRPIVIFSFLDDDIDRCVLSMREGQKPYFVLNKDQLDIRGLPIEADQRHFFASRPPEIKCYLCRLALFTMFPGWNSANHPSDPLRSKKKELGEAILLKLSNDLRARDLKHVFLVFEGLHRSWKPLNWRIKFLDDLFSRHNMPHIWARKAIEDNTTASDFDPRNYIVSSADEHPNRLANSIVSRRILDWLESGKTDHETGGTP